MTEAYIFDAVRTPRGRGRPSVISDGVSAGVSAGVSGVSFGASLNEITPIALGTQILQAIRDRNKLDTAYVEDVIYGCVTPVGEQGANIARVAALHAGYSETTAGYQLNRFCASGLEAVNTIAAKVKAGDIDLGIGGGVESMSRVPMGFDGGAIAVDPAVAMPGYFVPQGISADLIATRWGYSRRDADIYAVESQKRASRAWRENRFKRSIIPVKDVMGLIVLDHDEAIRPETSLETLKDLKPSFAEQGALGFDSIAIARYPDLERINHIHHAGNSSGIVDGAAAVLVGSKEIGQKLGLKPRARIISAVTVGSEPTIMLTGPSFAAEKALKRAGMIKSDIDIWELNEAFASVVLRFMDALDIDSNIINVNGGAIAMGHPLGATGAMILGTVVDELERSDRSTALISLCVGAGMGTATLIERV